MKRNFKVTEGELERKDMIAVLRLVGSILTAVEDCPEDDIDKIIRFADCSEFRHLSEEDPCLIPVGDEESRTTGFAVQGVFFENDCWWTGNICTVFIPSLAELTRTA